MKRKVLACVGLLIAGILLGACGSRESASTVEKSFSDSSIYSAEEIDVAMDAVIAYFEEDMKGCTLTKVTYDEEINEMQGEDWAEQFDADRAMLLGTVFDVNSKEGNNDFEFLKSGKTYDFFEWILTQDENGNWIIHVEGYT